MYAIVISALCGVLFGWLYGAQAQKISWIGDGFLNILKALAIPLILFSLTSAVASLKDIRQIGPLGGSTLFYYFLTTALAVLTGLILVNLIEPGLGFAQIENEIPDKVLQKSEFTMNDILAGISANLFIILILISLSAGVLLSLFQKKAVKVIKIVETLNRLTMKILHWFLWSAPIGIFAIVASKFGKAGDAFWVELSKVALYSLTVIIALFIHAAFTLPLILHYYGKKNPFQYFKTLLPALGTAFSTASSSATLPVTIESVSEEEDVPKSVSSFVLPLGATVNMDGTALYEAVAAVFIAQAYGIDLTIFQQVIIFFTANLAAIGAAGIPEAGLVTMIIVLKAVNLPLEGIGLLISIDWFLDRFRTTVNVWGDSVGALAIAKYMKKKKNTCPHELL